MLSYQEVLRMCKVSELDWCGVDLNNSKLDVSPPGCTDRLCSRKLYKHCRGSALRPGMQSASLHLTQKQGRQVGLVFNSHRARVVSDESEEMTVKCARDVRCPSSPLHLGFLTGFWAPGTVT